MCLAIPGRIVEISAEQPDLATLEVVGVRRKVNVGLLADEGVAVGDWVLVHVGFAMSKISEEAAAEQMRLLSMLGEDQQAMDELDGYTFGDQKPSERAP